MPKKQRITITDIARATGSSPATVSRVLNQIDYPVTPALKNKILTAAKELHYTPNMLGRMLKSGVSNDIGVVVPSLQNPFYAETVAGIERACRQRGYSPIFCSSENKPDKEWEYVELLRQKCVAGLIISAVNEGNDDLLQFLSEERNVVLIEQPLQNPLCDCDMVVFDYYAASEMATQYLLRKGHTDIAYLSTPITRRSRQLRYSGFCDTLAGAGITFDESRLYVKSADLDTYSDGLYEFNAGRALAEDFLRDKCPATAVFAINDIVALGVISGFTEAGFRVPQDVSVMGFDDINFSAMCTPPLTTIRQPSFTMGKIAADLLIDKVDNPDRNDSSTCTLLKPTIAERSSVQTVQP